MGLNTQQDPIGIAGGLNLYGYAGGDPINFSDPFGLQPCDEDETASSMEIGTEAHRATVETCTKISFSGDGFNKQFSSTTSITIETEEQARAITALLESREDLNDLVGATAVAVGMTALKVPPAVSTGIGATWGLVGVATNSIPFQDVGTTYTMTCGGGWLTAGCSWNSPAARIVLPGG